MSELDFVDLGGLSLVGVGRLCHVEVGLIELGRRRRINLAGLVQKSKDVLSKLRGLGLPRLHYPPFLFV